MFYSFFFCFCNLALALLALLEALGFFALTTIATFAFAGQSFFFALNDAGGAAVSTLSSFKFFPTGSLHLSSPSSSLNDSRRRWTRKSSSPMLMHELALEQARSLLWVSSNSSCPDLCKCVSQSCEGDGVVSKKDFVKEGNEGNG